MSIHTSPYSGRWYPAAKAELRKLLDHVFRSSESRTGRYLRPEALAYVVPHAGLEYSGTVAAAAYRALEARQPRRIILLGFTHQGGVPGIWIPEVDGIETPLGMVAVDTSAVRELVEAGPFRTIAQNRLCDHSIEIQLPLLQRSVPEATLVPIYVSNPDYRDREAAACRLASMVDRDTVLMASTDLTHFGRSFGYEPFPVDDHTEERLHELDGDLIGASGSLSPEFYLKTLQDASATVCGTSPVALLLSVLQHLQKGEEIFQEKLDYQTSGEITSDFAHSVSYAALGYYPYRQFKLAPPDQQRLLDRTWEALRHFEATGRRQIAPWKRDGSILDSGTSVFVTIRSLGILRGCIGSCNASVPLGEAAGQLTLAAALDDGRFSPVRPGEAGLEIDISVLSPMKRVRSTAEFRLKEHGLLLQSGRRSGLLLPQVAVERNWTQVQFLDALAHKAGLPEDVYQKPGTRLSVFRAQVIPERN